MTRPVGINIGGIAQDTTGCPFLNILKTNPWAYLPGNTDQWNPVGGDGVGGIAVDSNYYPTSLAGLTSGTYAKYQMHVLAGIPSNPYTDRYRTGNYVFLYDDGGGTETFSFSGTDATVVTGGNQPGRIVVNVATATGIGFTGISCSSVGSPYVKNFRLIYSPNSTAGAKWDGVSARPAHYGDEEWAHENDGEIFDPVFVSRLSPICGYLRFLDWTGSFGSQTTWATRPQLSHSTWKIGHVPVEVMIAAANKFNANFWLNVDAQVDPDYIEQLATLVLSDLNSNLSAWFEFYNEIWQFNFEGQAEFLGTQGGINFPNSFKVTGTASGTSSRVRLTLAKSISASFATGDSCVVSGVGGTTEANGTWTINVIDSTHIDLVGTTFANAWTSGGTAQVTSGTNYSGFTQGFAECLRRTAIVNDVVKNVWSGSLSRVRTVVNAQNVYPTPLQFCIQSLGTDWGGLYAGFTGSISGTTLTASSITGTIAVGQEVTGSGVAARTRIMEDLGGSTYRLNISQTVGSTAMTSQWWTGQLKDYWDVAATAPYWGILWGTPAAWGADADVGAAKIKTEMIDGGLLPTLSSAPTSTTDGTTAGVDYVLDTSGDPSWNPSSTPSNGDIIRCTIATAYVQPTAASVTFDAGTDRVTWTGHNFLDLTLVSFGGPNKTVTFDTTADTVNATAHGFTNGVRGVFTGTSHATAPVDVDFQTYYYVVNAAADTFQVSLTSGGSALDLTGSTTGTITFRAMPIPLNDENDANHQHNYYVRNISGDTFQLSTTPAGSILDLSVVPAGTTTARAYFMTMTVNGGSRTHVLVENGFVISGPDDIGTGGTGRLILCYTDTTAIGAAPIPAWRRIFASSANPTGTGQIPSTVSAATQSLKEERDIAIAAGKEFAIYECGQHFLANSPISVSGYWSGAEFHTMYSALNRSAEMGEMYDYYLALLDSELGPNEPIVHYSSVGYFSSFGYWGALENILQTYADATAPKYNALIDFVTAQASRGTKSWLGR